MIPITRITSSPPRQASRITLHPPDDQSLTFSRYFISGSSELFCPLFISQLHRARAHIHNWLPHNAHLLYFNCTTLELSEYMLGSHFSWCTIDTYVPPVISCILAMCVAISLGDAPRIFSLRIHLLASIRTICMLPTSRPRTANLCQLDEQNAHGYAPRISIPTGHRS